MKNFIRKALSAASAVVMTAAAMPFTRAVKGIATSVITTAEAGERA